MNYFILRKREPRYLDAIDDNGKYIWTTKNRAWIFSNLNAAQVRLMHVRKQELEAEVRKEK